MEFAGAWLLYHAEFDGRTPLQWFLDDPAVSLTDDERHWLEEEQAAWIGVWEVVEITPGVSLRLVDQLTGAERTVRDIGLSRTLRLRDALMARVVNHHYGCELTGFYTKSLPPAEAARVIEEMRRKLRRRREIPVARLRPEKIVYHLITTWEDVLLEAEARAAQPIEIQNTDGDEILWTVDHFDCDPEDRERMVQLLSSLPDIKREAQGDRRFSLVRAESDRPDETRFTVLGTFAFTPGDLVVETNSLLRANAVRRRLEEVTEGMLHHRLREHPATGAGIEQFGLPGGTPPGMTRAVLQESLDRYYSEWMDQPVPMLDDLTPRQASKTADGRRRLETLLKDFEHRQAAWPEGFMGPDVDKLRRELGMEELRGRDG